VSTDDQTYRVEHLVTFIDERNDIDALERRPDAEAWVPQAALAVGSYVGHAFSAWLDEHGNGRTGRFRVLDTTYGRPSVYEYEVTARTAYSVVEVERDEIAA
jgi:hypothetical protein